jgi:type IV pilus assembly protein PilE
VSATGRPEREPFEREREGSLMSATGRPEREPFERQREGRLMTARGAAAARASAGFTLIEVMIVVVVISVLAAIAVPSYRDYVVRSKRAAARQVLMEAAQYLERNYTTAGCYLYQNQPGCIGDPNVAAVPIVKPSTLLRAPSEGRASYVVNWALASSTFTLTATPCGDANCPKDYETTFKDETCGTLTLTQTGLRSASGSVSTCWQR